MQNPKLEDVAKLAGVSKTTVSRVLNNRGYLSEKTKAKVYDAMQNLHYQPNAVARQLYNKETKLIGLIFPTIANPFFGEMAFQLETKLFNKGYKVLIGNSKNDPLKEKEYLQQLIANQVDGLIVGAHNYGIEEYRNANLPIVAIDRVMNEDIPVVSSDNYDGGKKAMALLFARGAKHIIHTNGPANLPSPALERQRAYEDAMHAHHLPTTVYTVDLEVSDNQKREVFRQIFEEHPQVDAIFASNDVDASLIINVAKEFDRHVPADLLVVGYDGTEVDRLFQPELTTIVQPIESMATAAVETLLSRIAGAQTPLNIVLPVTIHHGETA